MKLSTTAIAISAAMNASAVYAGKAGKVYSKAKGSTMSKAAKTSKANAFTSFSYDPEPTAPTPFPTQRTPTYSPTYEPRSEAPSVAPTPSPTQSTEAPSVSMMPTKDISEGVCTCSPQIFNVKVTLTPNDPCTTDDLVPNLGIATTVCLYDAPPSLVVDTVPNSSPVGSSSTTELTENGTNDPFKPLTNQEDENDGRKLMGFNGRTKGVINADELVLVQRDDTTRSGEYEDDATTKDEDGSSSRRSDADKEIVLPYFQPPTLVHHPTPSTSWVSIHPNDVFFKEHPDLKLHQEEMYRMKHSFPATSRSKVAAVSSSASSINRSLQSSSGFMPTQLVSAQFIEVDTSPDMQIINQDNQYINVTFPDPSNIVLQFSSISNLLNPDLPLSEQMEYVPGGAILILVGTTADGEVVRNRMLWTYTMGCGLEDYTVLDGNVIGWAGFQVTPAREEFCPSSGNLPHPTTRVPTTAPTVTPITKAPTTEAPSHRPSEKPSPIPSVAPTPPTKAPTPSPTQRTEASSVAPTLTDCENPGTCRNRLLDQIYAVSVRMGTTEALDDPTSPQSQARAWIIEECDAVIPIDPCTASQLELNQQRYALAVMYFSLGGDSWNAGSNPGQDAAVGPGQWMSGLNYCEWGAEITGTNGAYDQLVCDDDGNVLNLNLQSNNMVGQIPPEIGVLKYMTSYIAFFNAQTGPIPTTLGYITSLSTFDVESNNLNGDLFQPEYAGPDGLTEIINFRASLNNFVGTIPADIGRWTKIQNLWFADNQITGTIPPEFGSFSEMGSFLFYKNQISGSIPPGIGNLNKLTWIDCEENQMVGTIPEEFYSNLDLEHVILKSNDFAGSISSKIGDLSNLQTLWLSFNELSGTIPSTFGFLGNLGELELQNNDLEGSIPPEFGNMGQIDFISLESNQLTGSIPAELFGINLAGLRILYLNNNQLGGQIPQNYGQAPRLQDLWLHDNFLTGTLPIISEGEFLLLEELLIQNNDITGIVDESVCLIRNNTIPGGQLGNFRADCQPPPNGGEPQIQCSCCTACYVGDGVGLQDKLSSATTVVGGTTMDIHKKKFSTAENGDATKDIAKMKLSPVVRSGVTKDIIEMKPSTAENSDPTKDISEMTPSNVENGDPKKDVDIKIEISLYEGQA